MFNLSATLNVFRAIGNPSLCVPLMEVALFNELSFPLKNPEIKALVLDKDNCFAEDQSDKVFPEYKAKWEEMQKAYSKEALLIVSNSAGTNDDKGHLGAESVEKNTGIEVLRHSTKKPGCYNEILAHFYQKKVIQRPSEVAIIGDRLFTDIIMANTMGAYGVWLSSGVHKSSSLVCQLERFVFGKLK